MTKIVLNKWTSASPEASEVLCQ